MGLAGLCKEFLQWAKNNLDVSFFRVRAEHVHKASAVTLTTPFVIVAAYFLCLLALNIWTGQGPSERKAGREVFPGSVSERLGKKFASPSGPQQRAGRCLAWSGLAGKNRTP